MPENMSKTCKPFFMLAASSCSTQVETGTAPLKVFPIHLVRGSKTGTFLAQAASSRAAASCIQPFDWLKGKFREVWQALHMGELWVYAWELMLNQRL